MAIEKYGCCGHLYLVYAVQASSAMHMPPRTVSTVGVLAAMSPLAPVSDSALTGVKPMPSQYTCLNFCAPPDHWPGLWQSSARCLYITGDQRQAAKMWQSTAVACCAITAGAGTMRAGRVGPRLGCCHLPKSPQVEFHLGAYWPGSKPSQGMHC